MIRAWVKYGTPINLPTIYGAHFVKKKYKMAQWESLRLFKVVTEKYLQESCQTLG